MTDARGPSEQIPCGVWFFPNHPAPELVSAIERCEELGIDEVWLGDEGPAREPFTVLAAAALRTSRIRLCIGITNPYVRHPGIAVSTAATIAELAPGRVVLGIGAGGAMSLDPFELTADAPLAAVDRMIEIARAAEDGRDAPGYRATDLAVAAAVDPLPIYVGARGPRLNTLASERADGAFIAGVPPFRFGDVVGRARSVRDIAIALYPSVAFDEHEREQHRPEMIWSLLDSPDETLRGLGLDAVDVRHAADRLRQGDRAPAAALIDDEVLAELMLLGSPAEVGARLSGLVAEHRPTSIGLALIADDLARSIDHAAAAFGHVRGRAEGTAP